MSFPASAWAAGPTWFVRALWVAILVLMGLWLDKFLDGFGVKDPKQIFSWHPLLMSISFAVLMSESVLVYRAFPASNLSRPMAKQIHGYLHTTSVILIALAWVAVFDYHNEKHIHNLYSVHSYLGITTTALLGVQWLVGLISFGWPRIPEAHRTALAPLHATLGLGVYFCGLATMLVGIQEKATFQQLMGKPKPGVYGPVMTIPATLGVLIVLLGLTVGYHFVERPAHRVQEGQLPLLGDDTEHPTPL